MSRSPRVRQAGASESGNTVTISTSGNHGLAVGQLANINGVGVAGYNGVFAVTSVPSPSTFTYTVPATTVLSGSSGGGNVSTRPMGS